MYRPYMTVAAIFAVSSGLISCASDSRTAVIAKAADTTLFGAPPEIAVDGKHYSIAFQNSKMTMTNDTGDSVRVYVPVPENSHVFFEYTSDGERIEDWSQLLTLTVDSMALTENTLQNVIASLEQQSKAKPDIIDTQISTDGKNGFTLQWIFAPNATEPDFEVNSIKYQLRPDCGGVASIAYAEKMAANSEQKVLQEKSATLLETVKQMEMDEVIVCYGP